MATNDIKLAREQTHDFVLRPPSAQDGAQVWRLIGACKPLDENSLYCNLLQCDHFSDTCVAAERTEDGALIGWISAYLVPDEPDTLFVWQVAVHRDAQGTGLGKKLLAELLERDACANVARLKTTITADNKASWGLFSSFARSRGGALSHEPHFRSDAHFDGKHETEHMVTIDFADTAQAETGDAWRASRETARPSGGSHA
ncbi:diaminobutyrate acetyltransferase [Nitratireductor indicus]|uniref:diaminobutyrate acetyltransferase n=1 Tax=Nitratireductor indicus TaxID=721133 RepID=UPI002874CC80|nr:diaminobutyrate acetyltransferase [Nitratireductor indicus]MDS1136604.1 diaminobutyrate acetyltransferase [Nitratireductor indicus]